MHNAPPVAFPVGRFVWGRVALIGWALLSALGLVGWQVSGQTTLAMVCSAWFFWALCMLGAVVWGPRQALHGGQLFWSGEAWLWLADAGKNKEEEFRIEVAVGLDLGSRLLLFVWMLDEQEKRCGLMAFAWLEEVTMPSKWHGFRCAVYSPAKTIHNKDEPISEHA
jgi:hypothetical protein